MMRKIMTWREMYIENWAVVSYVPFYLHSPVLQFCYIQTWQLINQCPYISFSGEMNVVVEFVRR